MARCYVGIGSNIDREHNIRTGVRLLGQRFRRIDVSPIYESRPVTGSGANYFNLVIGFDTTEPVESVFAGLKLIETEVGRTRAAPLQDTCALDLDLLHYAELVLETEHFTVPRADILRYEFVLRPLADLAPQERHPVAGATYLELLTNMRTPPLALRDVSRRLHWTPTERSEWSAS